MISKELLSEVLNIKIDYLGYIDKSKNIEFRESQGFLKKINIYELVHKNLKEWAYSQGFLIGLNSRQGVTLVDRNTNMVLRYISIDNLEQLIRFEINLCEWILDHKEIK